MGILDRISTLVKSNVNDIVSKAEDPEKVLNQAILDMESDLKKAKQQIVDSLAVQKQAELKTRRLRDESANWEKKAMTALQAGNEDLARQALTQKNKVDADIEEFDASVKTQAEYVGAIKSSLAMLEGKIEEAKQKRDTLVKRFKQAQQAQARAKQVEAGAPRPDPLSGTNAFDNFDRMVDKIELLESQVEAQRELMGDELKAADTGAELEKLSVDDQLRALKEKQASSVDVKLAQLKQEAATPVDDQLAALKKKLQES